MNSCDVTKLDFALVCFHNSSTRPTVTGQNEEVGDLLPQVFSASKLEHDGAGK